MVDARTLYRENAARGAGPVRQVVLLYEQIVEDLRRAENAIRQNRIEDRTKAINHATVVVGHLQSRLNFEEGGAVARNLERFYNLLRRKLLEAQVEASQPILSEQLSLLLDLRDAWMQVESAESARVTPAPPVPTSGGANSQKMRTDWEG